MQTINEQKKIFFQFFFLPAKNICQFFFTRQHFFSAGFRPRQRKRSFDFFCAPFTSHRLYASQLHEILDLGLICFNLKHDTLSLHAKKKFVGRMG